MKRWSMLLALVATTAACGSGDIESLEGVDAEADVAVDDSTAADVGLDEGLIDSGGEDSTVGDTGVTDTGRDSGDARIDARSDGDAIANDTQISDSADAPAMDTSADDTTTTDTEPSVDSAATDTTADDVSTADTSDTMTPADTTTADTSPAADTATADSGDARECTTACDCTPGLSCLNGRCFAAFAPLYCCGSPTCPGTSFCQFPNGNFAQCSSPDGGGGFDANFDAAGRCGNIKCNNSNQCMNAGCSACGVDKQCMP